MNSILRNRLFRSRWLAIGWFVLMTCLFFIPGSALPKQNWLTDLQFDKWVHIGFFAILVFLWRTAFHMEWKGYDLFLWIISAIYGTVIEILQGQLVPNRSFDVYDIIADVAGSILGLIIWSRVYKKNKPL